MASSSGDLTNGGGGGGGYMVHSGSGATASAPTTTTKTKPLTMFYNGGVAVFHLPQDKVHASRWLSFCVYGRPVLPRFLSCLGVCMHPAMATGGGSHEDGGG